MTNTNPYFILVRHGITTLNNPETEAIRGHSDIPLSEDGMNATRQTAAYMETQPWSVTKILCSPLQRAVMTANIIAEKIGGPKVVPTRLLSPWDLGNLTGKKITEVAHKLDYYQQYPDLVVPQGESYRAFFDRWTEGFWRMADYAEKHFTETLVGVVHSRNLLALPTVIGRKHIGHVPVKGGPSPDSVIKVYKTDDEDWNHEVLFTRELK